MTIRKLTEADALPMLAAWRAAMVHDRLSEWELRKAAFGSADHDPAGLLGACDGAVVLGFVASVVPPYEPETGRVAAVCAADEELTAELVRAAEAYLAGQGLKRIVAGEYMGCELAPGVDLRYEQIMAGFAQAGYSLLHTLDDMEIGLADYQATPYQQEARRRAEAHGVEVADWRPSLLEPLHDFAARAVPPLPAGWFGGGWADGPHMMVATRGEQVIGYASYWPNPEHLFGRCERGDCGAFGPIGVLEEHRGHGVGTWLLVESQLQVQRAGRKWLWAGWTNTPFYLPNGWQVSRQYAVWEKSLS